MATIQAKDIAAIFDKLRDQRDEARAEVELLKKTIGAGLLDYEANDVLNDLEEARAQVISARAETAALHAMAQTALDTLKLQLGTARAEVTALRTAVKQLTTCDCGLPLSTGKCSVCDRDE